MAPKPDNSPLIIKRDPDDLPGSPLPQGTKSTQPSTSQGAESTQPSTTQGTEPTPGSTSQGTGSTQTPTSRGTGPAGPKVVSTPVVKPTGDKEQPTSGSKAVSAPVPKPAGDVDEPEPEPEEEEKEKSAEENKPAGEKEKEPTAAEKAAALGKEAEIDKAKDLGVKDLIDSSKTAKKFESTERKSQAEDVAVGSGIVEGDKHAGQLSAEEWEHVLENCGAMYGWCIDRTKNRITRAPRPAFQLKTQQGVGNVAETGNKLRPSFSVNDSSRIDVLVSAHEFEESMAENDFSAQSTEGSVTGGFGGFGGSVSAGYATSKSTSTATSTNTYSKTMIAKFLCPRADVYLHAATLEATPELKAAIEKVRKTKNIKDLRQLQSDFGYLFCRRVTMGGRLQTKKIMEETTRTSEQEQKQSMKVSVGVAVTTPWVSSTVKHTNESGSASSSSTTDKRQEEQHFFEATGGDTLLATNPTAWAPTVGNHKNWRVIERDSLTLMVDAIASMDGLQDVKAIFAGAVPVLSKYLEFSDSLDKKIRLRLTSPNNGLSLSYLKDSAQNDTWAPPQYYLGHSPMWYTTPRAMAIDQNFWGNPRVVGKELEPLFSPRSYRAPAIYGYATNKVGEADFGTAYNEQFASTVWSIVAPYDEALCHESRVILRSETLQSESVLTHTEASGKTENLKTSLPSTPTSSLMIFRNQQGVFLPGMSDDDGIQIWRILKKGAAPGDKINIKEGDQVRLAWRFSDQTSGYRDFTDDVFGRRRTSPPAGMEDGTLYMKLPWPRFEPLTSQPDQQTTLPNALLMSENFQDSEQPAQLGPVNTVYAKKTLNQDSQTFALQDCTFRLDLVSNQGQGDMNDYLLLGIIQDALKFDVSVATANWIENIKRQQETAAQVNRQKLLSQQNASNVALGLRQAVLGPIAQTGSNQVASTVASAVRA
ncbi:hypothetical protein NW767_007094 [Fusarium falciforme]|nr:hypothetical protein NW767_007094 [Fusarium falciforme]KAJ4246157.1 hypothetical protein NW757_009612 [Fusarium falciforme]